MKKLTTSIDANENYLARIVKIDNIFKHPNADRLQCFKYNGKNIITGMDTKIGDIVIYFPTESQLSEWFLFENNQYQSELLNKDNSKKGMFNDKGRVKCISLRSMPSEGFIFPLNQLINDSDLEQYIGISFDTYEDQLLIKKYIPITNTSKVTTKSESKKSKSIGYNVKDIMIEDQFKFHISTSHLNDNIFKLELDDIIQISYKVHGSSGIVSNVLINKKLTWKDKIANLFSKVPKTEYGYIYSSGKPKSKTPKGIEGRSFESTGSYYGNDDIWKNTYNKLKPFLTHGLSIYYEIVGYTSNGGYIQKDYDYGCNLNENKIMIYRITYTNDQGVTFEFSAKQVQDWCKNNGLTPVHEMYYGTIKNLYYKLKEEIIGLDLIQENNWKQELIELLKIKYLEKDCFMCNNKVPEEGIVLRVEKPYIEVYKFKSFRFNERETKQNDKGIIDLESLENDI